VLDSSSSLAGVGAQVKVLVCAILGSQAANQLTSLNHFLLFNYPDDISRSLLPSSCCFLLADSMLLI
jgi:hypothetical protein